MITPRRYQPTRTPNPTLRAGDNRETDLITLHSDLRITRIWSMYTEGRLAVAADTSGNSYVTVRPISYPEAPLLRLSILTLKAA